MKILYKMYVLCLVAGCSQASNVEQSDSDSYTDMDTDTDADTDADTDSNTDTDIEVVIGAEWVTIPAGSFWMGSPDGDCPSDYPNPGTSCSSELGRRSNEELHYVTLTRSFELMRTEVTQGDFEKVMGWNPVRKYDLDGTYGLGADYPVTVVSWNDAVAYANALSANDGLTECYTLTDIICEDSTNVGTNGLGCMNDMQGGINSATIALNGVSSVYECTGYRLPTESEWEYAIRAGSLTAFYPSDGNDGSISSTDIDASADQIGWYSYNYLDIGSGSIGAHPVSGKEENAWGLYDMSGNVWEWTWDWLSAYPAGSISSPLVDPEGSASGNARVQRGGAYTSNVYYLRSAQRDIYLLQDREFNLGFRLSR